MSTPIAARIQNAVEEWRRMNRTEPDTVYVGRREHGELKKLKNGDVPAIALGMEDGREQEFYEGMRLVSVKKPDYLTLARQAPL